MSVYYCIPSKKPAAAAQECIDAWHRMGYRVAVWRDTGDAPVRCDLMLTGKYEGYPAACNALAFEVMERDAKADWLVFGGDDIWPDLDHRAEDIAVQCSRWFRGTFGVMQPTGDDWRDAAGRMIERIAGSPWCGREFCRRINGGNGPYWHAYIHCFVDNEIMEVAVKHKAFWQRPDIVHAHKHWSREGRAMPTYLANANSRQHWDKYLQIYLSRKAQGFPGSDPLPVNQEVCA